MSGLSQNLKLKQAQGLVMTPQLQQAIKLLQMNNIELAEMVEEELAENPLLEKKEPDPSDAPESDTPEPMAEPVQDDFDAGSAMMAGAGTGGNTSFDTPDTSFEDMMSKEISLRDHLIDQLQLSVHDPKDHMIGVLLIDQLDESGYLRRSVTELSEQLSCSTERIGRLLDIMKQFDPTGVFARDLQECMRLQLAEKGGLDAPMMALLDNMDLIASYDHAALAEKCGVNTTYLQDMLEELKTLDPKPGLAFDNLVVQTAIPDVLMRRIPKNLGGGWRVELNTATLPRVLVNNQYYKDVAKTATQEKDKEYLQNQLMNANWLVKAMDQRAQTILKVASEIIEQQDAFFNFGIEFLKPLTLKDIAEVVDVHESTVSRVTTNKYIGTPRGIFELKYFFTTALVSEDGTSYSVESIKSKVKNLIAAETEKTVLSDDKIVDLLKEEGIDIARRTIAKYREALNIPSSVQRRKILKNNSASA